MKTFEQFNEQILVHVRHDEISNKEEKELMKYLKTNKGKFDDMSDKGATFSFKSENDANKFINIVNKSFKYIDAELE